MFLTSVFASVFVILDSGLGWMVVMLMVKDDVLNFIWGCDDFWFVWTWLPSGLNLCGVCVYFMWDYIIICTDQLNLGGSVVFNRFQFC